MISKFIDHHYRHFNAAALKNASVAIVNAGARKFYLTKSRIQILLKHVTSVSFSTDASFC